MHFITIGQYFYKLFSAVLLILLVPIMAFIMVYLQVPEAEAEEQQSLALLIQLSFVVVFIWLLIFLLFAKKIKSTRTAQGLRAKLEKYFYLTIVRYLLIALGCIVLAYGFQTTKNDWFTGLFVLNLTFAGLLWPTASKATRDLKLRGDEREMVYFKKDTF